MMGEEIDNTLNWKMITNQPNWNGIVFEAIIGKSQWNNK